MKSHVALVGFMGAGKSTIGRLVASELRLPFVDTDEEIVEEHGPISELFERVGEAGFREREFVAARNAFEGPRSVVSLGGGALTHEPTRALVAERAVRIYLEIDAETLLSRLRRSSTRRPLAGIAPSAERINALLAAREAHYREAEFIVRGSDGSRLALARKIAGLL